MSETPLVVGLTSSLQPTLAEDGGVASRRGPSSSGTHLQLQFALTWTVVPQRVRGTWKTTKAPVFWVGGHPLEA